MKKLVFLLNSLTIACMINTYSQFSEYTYTCSANSWFEKDPNSDINKDWNYTNFIFTSKRNDLFVRNTDEKNSLKQLKSLKSGYPGGEGYVDNRMILDSTSLYYSHQPDVEGLKIWSSVYDYNARLNKIEEIYFTRNWTIGIMQKEHRYVYEYDAYGNQTELASYFWDSQTNEWIGFWRNVYIYGAKGNLAVLLIYDWDSKTRSWNNCWPKVDYTFNADGKLTEKIIYEWDLAANDRIQDERYVYKYDTKGRLTEEAGFSWDSSTKLWSGEYCYAYGYDSHGNQKVRMSYNWDLKTNNWLNSLREIYIYDVGSNLINVIICNWNSVINEWEWIYYIDYKSDSNGNLTELNRKSWDSFTLCWRFDERYVYTYDANGNITEETRYNWKPEINNWAETEKLISSWSYPLINDQAFFVNEKCSDCYFLGTITTGSTYNREKITFNFISVDENNLFTIDPVTGNIFLINPGDLNHDTDSSYKLTVEAHFKDSTRFINQLADITIYVNNINISQKIETSAITAKSPDLIKFYPNPATDFLYFEIPDNSKERIEVELINLAGQVVFSQSGCTGHIEISNLQSGIYLVKVKSEKNEISAGKVIINPNP